MDCRMTRGIYLRANGEINCYCSTGEQISLTKVPHDNLNYDFVNDYYLNGKFRHIRDSMKNDRLPFPTYCLKCNYLEPFGQFEPEKVETEIEWVHIEAAAVCNLKCPFCVHGIPVERRKYSREGPSMISVQFYNKILEDIHNAGLNIKWMYFSGRGEPGLHPDLWKMVETAKNLFDTNFLVNTNGNIKYDDMIVDSGLDKIKIALDSHEQQVYSRYRINGDVERLFRLTENIAAYKKKKGVTNPEIIWQKVMFDYNDSEEELLAYQRKALDLGVDTIKIVYTWTKDFSSTRPGDFPVIFPKIEFHDTFERDNLSLENLRHELQVLEHNGKIEEIISLLSRILHWFELGTETRDKYDDFANLNFSDPNLYVLRKNDINADEYKKALHICLQKLADRYKITGDSTESSKYSSFAEGLPYL